MAKIPFIPHELPIENLNWRKISCAIGEASIEMGRYDVTLKNLRNPYVLLSPITFNEAVLSSRIEGTQATLEEVFEGDSGVVFDENKKNDIIEILNYRKALLLGEQEIENRKISLELIKSLHIVLLDSVRGKDKQPGQFRKDQNWIGPYGCPIELAKYIPPNPFILHEHLEKLEKYMCGEEDTPLIQVAVAHAQFEIIHPFKDGNGRIGRILIPLLLYQKKTLSRPMFYLSEYFEINRREYEDRLLAISEENDWQGWIDFFLRAVTIQAKINSSKAQRMLHYYEEMKTRFTGATHSQFAIRALDIFFSNPIITSTIFIKKFGVDHKVLASKMLKNLRESNCIVMLKKGKGRLPATYGLPKLINIAEGKDIFPTTNQA